MKVILHNSDLVFTKYTLEKLTEFSVSLVSGTSFTLGLIDAGDYFVEVTSTSSTSLSLKYLASGQNYLIHTFTTGEFGEKIAITVPANATTLYVDGDGTYTIKIYSLDKFVKLGEITYASAYNSNKLFCQGSVSNDLATTLSAYSDIYIKMSDSNNLISMAVPNINSFHYDTPSTSYRQNLPWGVPFKSANAIVEGNIYTQYVGSAWPYTPTNGDTTIKIEFFRKV